MNATLAAHNPQLPSYSSSGAKTVTGENGVKGRRR
jgi:hypothetical protein